LHAYPPEDEHWESTAVHRVQQKACAGSVSSSGSQQAAELLPVSEEMNAEDFHCFKYISS